VEKPASVVAVSGEEATSTARRYEARRRYSSDATWSARLAAEFAQHCRIALAAEFALAAGAAVEGVPERLPGRSGDESDERDQNPDEEHREERGGRDHYCGRERLLVLVEDDVFQVLHVRGVVAARFERFDRVRGAR